MKWFDDELEYEQWPVEGFTRRIVVVPAGSHTFALVHCKRCGCVVGDWSTHLDWHDAWDEVK